MEIDELAQHLESLQRESCYRVDAVLKESPVEVTQRVYFVGDGAENGPFIRKFIKQGFGLGSAYESIYRAQQKGYRFKYLPDILECYMRDDELVVIMECVRGETLQEAVYERDPSLELAAEVFPKLCDAVGELHNEFNPPIIHRDLKPSNIILTGQGLVLIDFGISREYHEGAEADTTHFGTREFAPPEQFGFSQTTVKSDIYSLGMVLYFCLTETIPDASARNRQFSNPLIPEPIRKVIMQAVALDPANRFENTEALKAAFLFACSQVASIGAKPSALGKANIPEGQDAFGQASAPGLQNQVRMQAPFREAITPSAPKPNRGLQVLGIIWNCLLVLFFFYLVVKIPPSVFNQTGPAANNPVAFHYIYLCVYYIPALALVLFLVSDKRWLKKRIPKFQQFKWWTWLIFCAGIIFILALILMAAGAAMGAESLAYHIEYSS